MSEKSKLYKAYMNEANKQIKQSDKAYDQTISQANANALSRGMGRSSYALQTSANLENQKLEAGNQIKSDAKDAFIKAWLAYEQQQQALQLQRDQFEWQKQQAEAAAAAASSGGGKSSYTDNRPPWEKAGMTKEEYDKLYGNNQNNGDLFGGSKMWNFLYGQLPKYYGTGT